MTNEKPFKLDMSFDEALRRLAQTDPAELELERQKILKKEEEIEQFIREREESIRRGARRARRTFRP